MTNFIKAAATLDNIDDLEKDILDLINKLEASNRRTDEIISQGTRDINDIRTKITGLNNETDKIIELIKKEILEQS